ncbi:MAG: hypothetical protein KA314_03590 [Chloroflexi bacterium]|nr:hypothetical protein [Chloroflexota bacterium]MBP8054896.1 hypothetical protein [Chloroflexota bacterium]
MVYIRSRGRVPRSPRLLFRRLLFRLGSWLIRLSGATAGAETLAFHPYHLGSTTLSQTTAPQLQKAAEDFRAALSGLYPIHATQEVAYTDGGTTIWQGDGYQMTLCKSLTTVGEVHGYMFGPILKLDYPLAHGNRTEISHVTFYTYESLQSFHKQ